MKARFIWVLVCLGIAIASLIGGHYYLGIQPVAPGFGVLLGFWEGDLQLAAEWLVTVLLVIAFCWVMVSNDVIRRPAAPIALLSVLFWFWIVSSATVAKQPYAASLEAARWGIALLTLFVVVALAGRGEFARALMVTIAIVGTLCALKGVWDFALSAYGDPGYRAFGPFFNPDYFAGFLVMSLMVTLGLLAGALGLGRTLFGTMATAQLFALLLTGSRFGLASFIFAFIMFLFSLRWFGVSIKPIIARSAAIIAIVILLVVLFTAQFHAFPGSRLAKGATTESHSGKFRLLTWKGTARMIAAQPILGHGIGSFQYAYPKYAFTGYTMLAHSSYMQLSAETGVIGLLLFLGLIIAWYVLALQREKTPPNTASVTSIAMLIDDPRIYRAAVIAAITGACARNLVDSDLSIFANLITFWALIGLGLSLSVDAIAASFLPRGVRWLAASILGLSVITFYSTVGIASIYAGQADWAYQQAFKGENAQALLDDARSNIEWALVLDRHNSEYEMELGDVLLMQSSNIQEAQRVSVPHYQQAIRLQPSPKTYTRYASLLEYLANNTTSPDVRTQNLEIAIESLKKSLEFSPNDVGNKLRLAHIYERSGSPVLAYVAYQEMVKLEASPANQIQATPEFVEERFGEAYLKLAQKAISQSDNKSAIQLLESAVRIYEKYCIITRPLLKRFFEAGRPSIAGYTLSRDSEAMENYLKTLEALKSAYITQNQPEKARQIDELLVKVKADRALLKAPSTQ